jgi:hypothetical protein
MRECPVESATLVLRLKDGRTLEYAVSDPDAARLQVDRQPRMEDTLFGDMPIFPPSGHWQQSTGYPYQFTVTFGFRLGRRDDFLVTSRTEPPAGAASVDSPAP